LKPGGLARLQLNGLPLISDDQYTTWSGARFSSQELLEFTASRDIQVLAMEGAGTQYMWTTWRKQPAGWHAQRSGLTFDPMPCRIRRITNATSSEPVAPSRGRFASISVWVENLPADAGLHHLRVTIGEYLGTIIYIGPPDNVGLQQLTVILPDLEATGLLPVELRWLDAPLAPPTTLRVIPPGPQVPHLRSVTDGVNLVLPNQIETRCVKMTLEEISRPHELEATIDGKPVVNLEYFCIEPRPQVFEVNFELPEDLGSGYYPLDVRMGRRKIATVTVQVL
jgi:hypothetical protein